MLVSVYTWLPLLCWKNPRKKNYNELFIVNIRPHRLSNNGMIFVGLIFHFDSLSITYQIKCDGIAWHLNQPPANTIGKLICSWIHQRFGWLFNGKKCCVQLIWSTWNFHVVIIIYYHDRQSIKCSIRDV